MGAPAQAAGQWQPLEIEASCTALNTVVQPGETVTWVGACENGKATGPGVWASRYLQGGAWQDDVPHNYDGSSNAYELFTSKNMIKVYSFSTVASKVGDEFNKSVGKDVQAGNTQYRSPKKDLSIVRFKAPKFKMPKYRAPKFKVQKFKALKFKALKFKMPKFRAPKFKVQKFKAPKFKMPKFRAPKYKAPRTLF